MAKLDKLRGKARTLLTQFAKPIVVKNVEETMDTSGDVTTTVTDGPVTVYGYIKGYDATVVDGGTILASDLQVIIHDDGLGLTPKAEKTVVLFDGAERTVITAKPVYSGEQVALWKLQARI
jgi:hypothetical protein